MKRKRVNYVDLYKGVSQKSKKVKLGKRKSIKRSYSEISEEYRKKETCLLFSAVNLINTLVPFDLSTIQEFYRIFEEEYGIDSDGIFTFDIFSFIREYLNGETKLVDQQDSFEFLFLSNDSLENTKSKYYEDYINLEKTGEFRSLFKSSKEEIESTFRSLLSQNWVLILVYQINKRMKCLKCGNRVGFEIEEDKTHSIVLLPQIETVEDKKTKKIREIVCYLDSEVLGNKSTCNYCKVSLRNIFESFPKDVEIIAVRRKIFFDGKKNNLEEQNFGNGLIVNPTPY